MNDSIPSLVFKNKAVRVFFVLLVLFILYTLISALIKAHVTVITNSSNNVISITKMKDDDGDDDDGNNITTIVAVKGTRLSKSLPAGNYNISVTDKASGISKSVSLKIAQNVTYHLNIPSQTQPVSVLPVGILGLSTSDTQMNYLDSSNGTIYQLDSSGIPQAISPLSFKSAQWLNASFGLAQDNNGKLYLIKNNQISLLSVPFAYSNNVVSYSVGPTGMVYVSSGKTVYAGLYGTNFKKFFTANSGDLSLYAGSKELAVVALVGYSSGSKGPTDELNRDIIIVSPAGQELSSVSLDVDSVTWSPLGDKIAAVDNSGQIIIYGSDLKKITTTASSVSSLAWDNDNSLLYSTSTSIWKLDTQHNQAVLLSSTPEGEIVSNIFINGEYVYFSANSQTEDSSILLRIGLDSQANDVPSYYSGLSVILPTTIDQCSFTYSNFDKLYLIINGWSDPNYCMAAAQSMLSQDGLQPSNFNIVLSTSNSFNH